MATLHIDDFPDEVYDTLCKKAKEQQSSVAAVLTELVRRAIPTEFELAARHAYFKELSMIHAKPAPKGVDFKSTEEALREDRER